MPLLRKTVQNSEGSFGWVSGGHNLEERPRKLGFPDGETNEQKATAKRDTRQELHSLFEGRFDRQ